MRIQKMDSSTNCARPQTSFKQILVGNKVASPENIELFFKKTFPQKGNMDIFQKAIQELVEIDKAHNAGQEKEFIMDIVPSNQPDFLTISIGNKDDITGLLPKVDIDVVSLKNLSKGLKQLYDIFTI